MWGVSVTSHFSSLATHPCFQTFGMTIRGKRIALHTWGSLGFSTQSAVAFCAVVISSEVEKSSLQMDQRCVLESVKRQHQGVVFVEVDE